MAKPIFVVKLNSLFENESVIDIADKLENTLNHEYHVLITKTNQENHSFECFNDCKGLLDIDIKKLIKEFEDGKVD